MNLAEIRQRMVELHDEIKTVISIAEAEKRDLSKEEADKIENLQGDFQKLEREYDLRQRTDSIGQSLSQPEQRQTTDLQPGQRAVDDPGEARVRPSDQYSGTESRRWGWRSLGEHAAAVRQACVQPGAMDPRLQRALTTYGSEGVGADGGFAVPPEFSASIVSRLTGEDSLLGRTDLMDTTSNQFTFPVDETTAWQTTGGVLAYWTDEAAAKTQSKPALIPQTLRLNKLTCLVPVTDELLEDATAMDGYLRRKAAEKMTFAVNLAIVQGNGVGKPQGILNSSCLVSVAKETSQVADTVLAENIFKMYARMYAPYRSRSMWLINQDVEPQLFSMVIPVKNVAGTENVGGGPVYIPAGGLSASPYGSLMGRPVFPTQACETLGDKGDIIFAAMGEYLAIQKTGGVRTDVSIHLWFDQDTTAFRFVMRLAGQPWLTSTISPRDGTNTLSSFVTLDERG